jgi:hypothetical protein
MFVSTVVSLTPEIQKKLQELQDSGAFGDTKADFIRLLLQQHLSTQKSSPVDIARETNLSLRMVRHLGAEPHGHLATKAYASVFLSYGGPDEAFARRIYERLTENGVETFFFPESAPPGQRLHRTMSDGVHEYDRVLLICSRSALVRVGVLNELEQVLAREAREGGTELLMPVLLDDFALGEWAPAKMDLARQLRDRVAADFRNTSSPSQFTKQLNRVLRALKQPP